MLGALLLAARRPTAGPLRKPPSDSAFELNPDYLRLG